MFYIGFTTAPQTDDEGWPHALGGIELGSDSDGFAADLRRWSVRDYEGQWREGVARLAAGHPSSALITSYAGPDGAVHSMWPMWRVGNTVFLQQRLVPSGLISPSAGAENFYGLVGERHTVSEHGEPISEWLLPFADVLAFLTSE
jgi:hypothetical protein